ncbi:ester cyclase [Thalassococcus sp. CAU 1522]|uniref:Ester cyclase n=1 Tax=Thalassococcus arenae TaxID=2851652 RepID=A0ABS6N6D7_9RHOB|nr:ester cyclase [Thalassococcus arenae]MBV2359573.1 ester cyclase [Thalassococcus arenae]
MIDFRSEIRLGLDRLWRHGDAGVLADRAFADLAWPLNRVEGRQAILDRFIAPLRAAFTGLHRRDLLFIGGRNIRETGGTWCACVTHYVGTFTAPLWGIAPSTHLAFLRAGEFYRVENGRIAEIKIIFDLPDLLRQCGRMPFPRIGTELAFPAPATQDGLLPTIGNGDATIGIINGMIADLHVYDPKTGASKGQTGTDGYWHEDMMWYGPAGIGSNFRWDGFVQDHRASFLNAFPDRRGGNHYCRFGDGNYAAISGWPSMTMTWQGDYLGLEADGRALTLRVMDFYRCDGRQICENWVCLDYGDLYRQMGGVIDGIGI